MQCIVTNSTLVFDFIFFLLGQATDYVLSFVGGSSVAESFHGTSELTRTRRYRYVCRSYIQRCMYIVENNRPIGRSSKQKFRFRNCYKGFDLGYYILARSSLTLLGTHLHIIWSRKAGSSLFFFLLRNSNSFAILGPTIDDREIYDNGLEITPVSFGQATTPLSDRISCKHRRWIDTG